MAKGPDAFRTISEAADEVGVPQHVLRFWETKFSFIRPMKRAGGRRFYRPADLEVLRGVRTLLHQEGYTIKGVQRLYKEEGGQRLIAATSGEKRPRPVYAAEPDGLAGAVQPPPIVADSLPLSDILRELEAAKSRLDAALGVH